MADFRTEYEEHLSTWGPNCGASLKTYKGHLDRLLAPLHEEVARLRKDSARLDWLEKSAASSEPAPTWTTCWEWRWMGVKYHSLRIAIDAAMRGK